MGYDLINKVIPLGGEGEVVLRSNTKGRSEGS